MRTSSHTICILYTCIIILYTVCIYHVYMYTIQCIYVHNTMYICLTVVDMVCMFSFIQWMYPSGGGEENVESAALGIIILWTTWYI